MFAKKLLTIVVFALAVLLFSCCAAKKIPEGIVSGTGFIRVRVLDGMSETPLSNAEVVIPETGGRYKTGEKGLTSEIELPVIPDSEYDKLLPNAEGRITLLVLAEGYTPYLLLYARVKETECREIEILMFPADGTLPVFTVIEAPSQLWARELMDRYK